MKIDLGDRFHSAFYEILDAAVVARLKQSMEGWGKLTHPDDRRYSKKYNKACKLVIKHFGG